MKPYNYFIYLAIIIFGIACSPDKAEIDQLLDKSELLTEVAKNVEVLYSDSAIVRVKLIGPTLKRHIDRANPLDEFPDGVHVEFYGPNRTVNSYLDAKYALRKDKEDLIIARDSVVLWNKDNEKLETSELIWDEKNEKIYSDKFVRISQPTKGDTSYGYGFEANQDFSEFQIKRKFSAKMNVQDLSKALGN